MDDLTGGACERLRTAYRASGEHVDLTAEVLLYGSTATPTPLFIVYPEVATGCGDLQGFTLKTADPGLAARTRRDLDTGNNGRVSMTF